MPDPVIPAAATATPDGETHAAGAARLARVAPGLAALRAYRAGWLRSDVAAGLSVAAVALPTSIAYAQLAGFPPIVGLYGSLLPLVAYALFGTSRRLVVNPDAATCAMIAAIVTPLAAGSGGLYVVLASALAVLAGLTCVAAGLFRRSPVAVCARGESSRGIGARATDPRVAGRRRPAARLCLRHPPARPSHLIALELQGSRDTGGMGRTALGRVAAEDVAWHTGTS